MPNPQFPAFDQFHAHCQLETNFSLVCSELMAVMYVNFENFTDPAKGTYKKVEESADYFWFTRTTPVKHYVDDVEFTLSEVDSNTCKVTAKSRSQSLSYYDYNTNFCNMYNVIRETKGVDFSPVKASNCKFQPDTDKINEICN